MIRFVKRERLLVLCSRNAGSRAVTDWPRDARERQKRRVESRSLLARPRVSHPRSDCPLGASLGRPRTAQNDVPSVQSTGVQNRRSVRHRLQVVRHDSEHPGSDSRFLTPRVSSAPDRSLAVLRLDVVCCVRQHAQTCRYVRRQPWSHVIRARHSVLQVCAQIGSYGAVVECESASSRRAANRRGRLRLTFVGAFCSAASVTEQSRGFRTSSSSLADGGRRSRGSGRRR
jgi:hypothetical protein